MPPSPQDSNKSFPGSCGGGEAKTDSDSDCFPDRIDECPQDCEEKAPGVCGCGVGNKFDDDGVTLSATRPQMIEKTLSSLRGSGEVNTDSDSDNFPDCDDAYPQDPTKTLAGNAAVEK